MRIAAFFNRDGGTFRTTDMDAYVARAEAVFGEAGHTIEPHVVSGAEIVPALERAARRDDIDALIAGGGDGTVSAAAGIAWKAGLPLGVVPAGTMNLFARSLKLPLDINGVLDVLARGTIGQADIGSADGRAFVHQFTAGMHARMVRLRNAMTYRSRIGKIAASVRASAGVILNPPRFEVEIDVDGHRDERMVSAISVTNNPYGANSLLYPDSLDAGHLGFYVTDPLSTPMAIRWAADILLGRIAANAAVTEMQAQIVELHFPKLYARANCVLDGELVPLGRTVRIELHPGELKVLQPA